MAGKPIIDSPMSWYSGNQLTPWVFRFIRSMAKIICTRFVPTARWVISTPTGGRVAPEVTEWAAKGDPLALAIMTEAGQEIATTLQKMGWHGDLALCLTGGIAPEFRPYLPPAMQAAIIPPAGTPLDGALALAQDFAREARHDHH